MFALEVVKTLIVISGISKILHKNIIYNAFRASHRLSCLYIILSKVSRHRDLCDKIFGFFFVDLEVETNSFLMKSIFCYYFSDKNHLNPICVFWFDFKEISFQWISLLIPHVDFQISPNFELCTDSFSVSSITVQFYFFQKSLNFLCAKRLMASWWISRAFQ